MSIDCQRNDVKVQENMPLDMAIQGKTELIDSTKAVIYLKVTLGRKQDYPFYIDIVHKGLCYSNGEVKDGELEKYANDQIIPLLLPYARESVSSIMTKMNLPVYTIPTIDVLGTLKVNRQGEDIQ